MASLTTWSIGVTLVVHVGIAAAVSTISSPPPPRQPTKITIQSAPPRKAPPPPPLAPAAPAPPPPAPAPTKAPPPKAAPKLAAAAPAPAPVPPVSAPSPTAPAGPASYGVKMNNGGGAGASVPNGGGDTAPAEPVHKTLGAEPTAGCADAPTKPKPVNVVQPAFTTEAQEAGITGKVRVEITISASGQVTNARVIEGLGYGLDEAALAAAKASTFSPATKCGEAIETTFTIGMRFQH